MALFDQSKKDLEPIKKPMITYAKLRSLLGIISGIVFLGLGIYGRTLTRSILNIYSTHLIIAGILLFFVSLITLIYEHNIDS